MSAVRRFQAWLARPIRTRTFWLLWLACLVFVIVLPQVLLRVKP